MAEPAREPEDATAIDDARIIHWVGPAFVLFSVLLIPWSVYLGVTLPAREESPHYNIAWAGFDVLLLVVLGASGYFAFRRSRYLAVTAVAAATLLVVDAWFDIMTSPKGQIMQAVILALVVELPLAAVCAWLSYHTENLAERRIVLRTRRARRRPQSPAASAPGGAGPGGNPHQ